MNLTALIARLQQIHARTGELQVFMPNSRSNELLPSRPPELVNVHPVELMPGCIVFERVPWQYYNRAILLRSAPIATTPPTTLYNTR